MILALAAFGLSLSSAFAQIPMPIGQQKLLAGWDMNLNGQSTTPNPAFQLARYSDVFGDSLNGNVNIGRLSLDGVAGADAWGLVSRPSTGADIDRAVLGRTLATQLGSLAGNEGMWNLSGYADGTKDEFSLLVHTQNAGVNSFQGIKLSLWGKDSIAGGDSITVNWGYRTTVGGPTISTGLSSSFSNTSYEESFLDFSAITAMNNLLDLYLVGEVVEGTGAASTTANFQFDNIAIYGTAMAQGLTFWKGGAGAWTAAATPANWLDAVGSSNPADKWGGGVATFGGTAGTVTVDIADGPVTFTGAKFVSDGYVVAAAVGSSLTTTTAATGIQVDPAMTATISAPITGTGGGINKTGTGTLVLSGANTYTGATTITDGTLKLHADQSGATGAVTVKTGGTLSGVGSLLGKTASAVTVENGGTLAGATGSTLTTGALTLNASSNVNVTLGALNPAAPLFVVNGNLALAGTLNVASAPGFGNGLYRLFDFTGTSAGTLALGAVPGAIGDFSFVTTTANQFNLLVNSTSLFWAGGNGNWATGGAGWNNAANAAVNYTPTFAIFNGAVGTVTVDPAGVEFQGAQFVTDGYTVTGGALNTLTTAVRDVRVDSTKTATIASAITGTGGINKRDLGTLVLSGANTHSGGTTVSEGTLQLGSGGTTGSVAGNITTNATLAFNRSDAVTFAGNISGTGAVTKLGTNTLSLTGTNTHLGGTTVTTGTLSIGAGGTAGSITGNITNNATVAFNRSDAATIAGNISGTGAVTKLGANTLSLTGASTHTGGTTVTTGTLSIGAGGTTGSVTGNIVNDATLAFNRSDALTHAGIISGTGAVTKLGTGTTTFSGANTYTGTTTVSAGKLLVNGNQTASTGAITVATGATLGGTGTAGGAVTIQNGGTLSGATGGTFTLPSLVLNSTSNVDVSLGAPGATALFQVNGNFTLDGLLNIIAAPAFGDGLYRLFNYTGTLTNNTMTVGTAPGGAAGYTIQTATANQVSVLSAGSSLPIEWAGGSGTWSSAVGGTGWGASNGPWSPGFALFGDTGGTVTLAATTTNPVIITGVQFAVDEYEVSGTGTGNVLTTNTANTPFRVGDGTSAGATMAAIISAPIAGTGGVDKTDFGTLVLTSTTSSYTGGTRVSAGVLQVFDDKSLGATTGVLRLNGGTLRAGATLTSARSVILSAASSTLDTGANDVTLSGVITGSGALTKRGTGKLTVSGTNTNTGLTTIAEGAIVLGGTTSSLAATTVSAGARLTGSGTIRGNLTNAGQLSPGASPGTINVVGNLTQSATGTYTAELASATSYDKIVVSGSATLAGTLTVTNLNGFAPASGQAFKIIEATGGVTGKFTTVVPPTAQISAMLQFAVTYKPSDVSVGYLQLPFAGLDGTPNQLAVGSAVDGALAAGKIPTLTTALNAFPTQTDVLAALSQLSPQIYERWGDQAVFSSSALVRSTESRLGEKQEDPSGGLWMEIVRRQADYDAIDESTKAKSTSDGIMVGGDMPVSDNFQVGLAFAYTNEEIDLDTAGSSTAAERFTGTIYARYEKTRAFAEGVIGASYSKLENQRVVDIPGASGTAEGTTEGGETFVSARTGFNLPLGKAKLTPYLALQYTSWQVDELVESGAGDASLTVHEQHADSLATRVGLVASLPYKGKTMTFTPRLDLAWRFEFRDEAREITAELGDTEFTVLTKQPAGSGFHAGLGFDATWASGTTAYARVTTESNIAADDAFEAKAGVDFRF